MEKFILFPLEEKRPDSGARVASAWEYEPSNPDRGLRRVHEFGPSTCEAWLVFWEQPALAPEYIRVPIEDQTRNLNSIRLCHIDYRTWDVRTLIESPRGCEVVGMTDRWLHVSGDDRLRLVDRKTLQVHEPALRCAVQFNLGFAYLVTLAEGIPKGALFDRDLNRLLPVRFAIPGDWSKYTHLVLSPDRARIAELEFEEGVDPKQGLEWHASWVVAARLRIHDLATGGSRQLKIHTIVDGTNRPFLWGDDDLLWSLDGSKVMCRTWLASDEGGPPSVKSPEGYEMLTIDAKTLSVTSREPLKRAQGSVVEPEESVPAYLREAYDATKTATEGGRRLAHAFLRHMGVQYEIPYAVLETEVGFTSDRRRFLLKMGTGPAKGEFFYGDLEKKELRRVPAPPAIAGVLELEIFAVTLP